MNTATHDTHIAEYSATEAGLTELRARLTGVLYSVETTRGMDVAVRDRAEVRGLRTALERKRVEIKRPALDFAKRIDSEAKRITELLEEIEAPIDSVIRTEQARKEAVTQARINAEFARVTAIQEAIGEIRLIAAMAEGKGSERIHAAICEAHSMALDPLVFQEMLPEADAALTAVFGKLDLMFSAALHVEAEAAKLAAERAELAELRAAAELQKSEAKKQAAFDRAELLRLQAESAVLIAAQQAEIARQMAEIEAARVSANQKEFASQLGAELFPVMQLYGDAPVPVVVEIAADAPDISTNEICMRLMLMIPAGLITKFGFSHNLRNGCAVWREADFRPICAALVKHIQGVAA